MRKTVALPFIGIALASVIAAGCSGTGAYNPNANSTPTPLPSPTIACTTSMFPAGEQVQMVFPQNGGTAVANLQGVVFAVAPNPLPTNWFVYAVTPQGSTEFTNSIAFLAVPTPAPGSTAGSTPTPLPTPSDTPSPGFGANPIYETASIGTFANSTNGPSKFTIFLATASCSPGIAYSTFTTSVNDQPSPSPSPTST
jgi:hypothetical protein